MVWSFIYLNASFKTGFSKEQWTNLNQPIDQVLVDTLFRLLVKDCYLTEPSDGLYIIKK
ncbi:hypothetical protein KHA80_09120 [Anaerobacillus sp. HL2]|nr:hypothetical protein KHA80_09120 [Anaerobacillus sp. HL2]